METPFSNTDHSPIHIRFGSIYCIYVIGHPSSHGPDWEPLKSEIIMVHTVWVSILNISYVKKTKDINTVNRVKSGTDGVIKSGPKWTTFR